MARMKTEFDTTTSGEQGARRHTLFINAVTSIINPLTPELTFWHWNFAFKF
jgi:hypothetical protein